jgi:putative membrane protein
LPVSKPSLIATAVITLLAYSILGYLLTGRPETVGSDNPLSLVLPHAIAVVNLSALVSLQLGYRAVRHGEIGRHRLYMLLSFILISAFLVMYVTRLILGGVRQYGGPEILRLYIYLPALTIHLALSIVSIPLVLYNISVGLTTDLGRVRSTGHPTVGRWAVRLWSASLALGILVYLMLNWMG